MTKKSLLEILAEKKAKALEALEAAAYKGPEAKAVGMIDDIGATREDLRKFSTKKSELLDKYNCYYLDEKLLPDKISKEKIGNKYIITIPFK